MSKLDPSFMEELKRRIERARDTLKIVEAVQALNEIIAGTKQVTREQMKAIELTLKHGLPLQKEHTGEIRHTLAELVSQSMQSKQDGNSQRPH